MKLSILTVNYNTEAHIVVLLEMLTKQIFAKNDFEVIITNNVQNPTLAILTQPFTELLNLQIVQSTHNVGFGRANNMAAAQATGEHLLIMNPDIQMIQDDYLEQLYHHAQKNPDYGLITTQILDQDGHDGSEFYRYEFGENLGFQNQTCWFSGALMLIRKNIFDEIGGFDPDFFMYCEDEDLSYRIKRENLILVKSNTLKVLHIGGVSEPFKSYDMYYRNNKSKYLFALKHYQPNYFQSLVTKNMFKSKLKIFAYLALSKILRNEKHSKKVIKYQADLDILKKISTEGTEWLFFR